MGDEPAMAVTASVNWIELLSKMDQVTGLPAGILNAKEEAEARLATAMQAMQQAAQAEQMTQSINNAQTLGATSTEEGTALGDLKDAVDAF